MWKEGTTKAIVKAWVCERVLKLFEMSGLNVRVRKLVLSSDWDEAKVRARDILSLFLVCYANTQLAIQLQQNAADSANGPIWDLALRCFSVCCFVLLTNVGASLRSRGFFTSEPRENAPKIENR